MNNPIRILILAAAVAVLPAFSGCDDTAFRNRVASGDTTPTSTVLWALVKNPGSVEFVWGLNPQCKPPVGIATALAVDPLIPVKVPVSGLKPGTSYHYAVVDANGNADFGRFRTAPAANKNTPVRFGVSGDWRGELSPYPSVTNAPDRDLDFFVEFGDTVYADVASPDVPAPQATTLEEYRAKHREVYGRRNGLNALGALRASTSVLAVIDDHEVTNDFAGGAPPSSDPRFLPSAAAYINETTLFANGLQAFQEYNPIRDLFYGATGDPRTAGKRKLYRSRVYGRKASVFMLDTRSFRDPELPGVTNLGDPAQVGAFLVGAFNPARTMLGAVQLDEFLTGLLQAETDGVTWKFVLVPEPIQNLGVLEASDRYEGYAFERTRILKFIGDHGIRNVVFVTADIHGTLVNNLTYQLGPGQPQIATDTFEISTGPVAYSAPFGPTVIGLAAAIGLISPAQKAFYDSLPVPGKDAFLRSVVDSAIAPLGYDPLGLEGSSIPATLVEGSYVATHVYGWTEFDIDRHDRLEVTTYGIPWYSPADLAADPAGIASRVPAVVSRFRVEPR